MMFSRNNILWNYAIYISVITLWNVERQYEVLGKTGQVVEKRVQ